MNDLNLRFELIMARVDAWAEENAGWDCRGEAAAEVYATLSDPDCMDWDEDRHAENAIQAWMAAE